MLFLRPIRLYPHTPNQCCYLDRVWRQQGNINMFFLIVTGISGQHWFGGRGGWVITISNYFLSLWEPVTWNLRSSFCASSHRLPNPEWALWALSATKNKVKTIILKLLFFALTTLMALIGIFAIYGKTPKPAAWNPRSSFCATSRRLPNHEWALWALSATKNKVKTIIVKLLFFALTTLMALIGIFAIYGKTSKRFAATKRDTGSACYLAAPAAIQTQGSLNTLRSRTLFRKGEPKRTTSHPQNQGPKVET